MDGSGAPWFQQNHLPYYPLYELQRFNRALSTLMGWYGFVTKVNPSKVGGGAVLPSTVECSAGCGLLLRAAIRRLGNRVPE